MKPHLVSVAVVCLFAAPALCLAQAPAAPAAPVAPAVPAAPAPAAPPAAPAPGARAPRAARPFMVVPPAPPVPPLHLDLPDDFNVDLDIDFSDLDAIHVDVDAIRESARAAAESAREQARDAIEHARDFAYDFQFNGNPPNPPNPPAAFLRNRRDKDAQGDALYSQARQSIEEDRYDRAIEQLNRLVNIDGYSRIDAALYWKSYALAKQGQRPEALTTLADLAKRFADSRWLKDARALEVELRQASGQAVSPDSQNDEELKLLALRGIMRSDPERALPMIEKFLGGSGSVRARENALFVLSQSRLPKAREIISGIARGGANPDLQLRAIRYLGAIGGPESRQALEAVYGSANDAATKRAVMQALVASGATDKLIDIARTDKDPDNRRVAIRYLGSNNDGKASEALRGIYTTDASPEVKREIINALGRRDSGAVLVQLARAEKDPALKREIVQRLSNMKSKEATDYLLELLK